MKTFADTLEKVIGRRATSCFGVVLLVLMVALIAALLWPKIFPKQPAETPEDQTSR